MAEQSNASGDLPDVYDDATMDLSIPDLPSNYAEWFDWDLWQPEVERTDGENSSSISCLTPAVSLQTSLEDIDMNNPANLELYTEIVMFFASSQSTLEITDCGRTKETAVRIFAAKFNLEHWYNAERHISLLRRPEATVMGTAENGNGNGLIQVFDSSFNAPFVQETEARVTADSDFDYHGLHLQTTHMYPVVPKQTDEVLPDKGAECPQHRFSAVSQDSILGNTAPSSEIRPSVNNTIRQGMRALKLAGGACWRCKILRKKCDPGNPCKACPNPAAKSTWQVIGCQRGPLGNGGFMICPRPSQPSSIQSPIRHVIQAFLGGAAGRMAEALALTPPIKLEGIDSLESSLASLQPRRCLDHHHDFRNSINKILWELQDNTFALAVMRIQSLSSFEKILLAAARYEAECGKTSLVTTSLACLYPCLQHCRLANKGLLKADIHNFCAASKCDIVCSSDLELHLQIYVDELSRVIFRKENLQSDRNWWLSVYYSLYIQSCVRHTLILIEQPMTGHLVADSNNRLENLVNSREYLHTFVRLFAAASAGFDPIGMHPNQSPAVPSQFTSYIQEARNAFASDETATAGMKNSFDFMKEKFEIGPESRKGDGAAIPTSAENVTSSSAWDLDVQVEYHKIPQTLFPLQDDNCSSQYDFVDSRPDSPATPLRKSGSRMKRRANSPPDDLGFPGVRSSTESLNEKFKQHSLSRKASSSSMNSAFEDDEDRIYSEVKGRLTVAEVQSLELSFLQNPKPTSFKKRELAEQMMVDVARINNWFQNRRARAKFEARAAAMDYSYPQTLPSSSGKSSYGSERSDATAKPPKSPIGPPGAPALLASLTESNDAQDPSTAARPLPRAQSVFTCDCCPKKPKKFATLAEMIAHESENQYRCTRCGCCFRNKNEVERHENTLHTHRHFWSCSRIGDYSELFFQVGDEPVEECGYCGKRYPAEAVATKQELEDRVQHLQEAHKFRECNSAKRFYRADHFRQHLKYSHSAVAGQWTEELEMHCLEDAEVE